MKFKKNLLTMLAMMMAMVLMFTACGGSSNTDVDATVESSGVVENGGVDPEKYSGCAFGLGLDRMVMLSMGLKDIRDLNSGNLKLLNQFKLDV